ncbi:hypothetical protein P8452_05697 [Trifolium repens]|nr:hypothetical protein P8452_05697 [Trifolium repens]
MDKLWSFSSRTNNVVDTERQRWEEERDNLHEQLDDLVPLSQVLEDVDCFLDNATSHSYREEVPNCVVVLHKLLESTMDKYNKGCNGRRSKFGKDPKDDNSFLYMVDRIFKLSTTTLNLSDFYLDQTSSILERVMFILENDLCALLQDPVSKYCRPTPPPKKSSSFGSLQFQFQLQDERESLKPNNPNIDEGEEDDDLLLPTFSTEDLSILNKIATVMINVGYHTECCMAFTNFRRIAFKNVLQKLGYTCIRMDEVYKMQWGSLEGEIATWNRVFRHCTSVLFNTEKKLYNSVFSNQPHISRVVFSDIAQAVIVNFLNFAQAVVLTKPSPEKLFKFLDMYETLRDEVESVIVLINDDGSEQCAKDLGYELAAAKHGIIEAVVAMFYDLENSIKGDNERIPVPYGAVHPLTRYVMNYLKYACEYKVTLEQVFCQYCTNHYLTTIDRHYINNNNKGTSTATTKIQNEENNTPELDETPKKSPFVVQLMTIMDLLDVNTERKSMLYRDMALRCIFLMNNGRYIVQKIKGCVDLHESMGDNWCRRMQSSLRLHHKSYQRETWTKVVQCLNPDGLQQQGNKVSKQILRERFKCFNSMFEEIHKTQSSWIVSDEQLQSELRVSICSLVIPAYRSFMGRFKHHLESGKHIDKYIKYHPDDLETLIDDFFVGNATSMPRRRT